LGSRRKSKKPIRPEARPAPPQKRQRRWWIVVCVLAVICGVYAIVTVLRRPAAFTLVRSADQNVLLITIDTLREDAMSCYGGPARTPNIDALAAHGARFTFAHAHVPLTLPSHTSILSGLLPYQTGIRDNGGFRVKAGTPTLATRLKTLGFATGAFVGGFPLTKRFGLTAGFDDYDDQMPEMRGAIEASMPERPANMVVSRALDWIGKQNGRFFAWVHVYDPHSPYRPPPEFAAQYSEQPYYGEIAFVDQSFGPLFNRLATLPRPTTVILTADHGESLGEHGEQTHGMFAYEATLHVPLIIARITPGHDASAGGIVIDTPVRHIDIAPTVLDVVGARADSSLPGRSLEHIITGDKPANPTSYFEAMSYNLIRGWAPLRGVIEGRDKYIDLPIQELYHLGADPREAHNDAPKEPDRVRVMLNLLKTFNMAPPDRPTSETAETEDVLRSLGYVSGSAPAKARYTEADDPKTLVGLDNDLHTASNLALQGNTRDAVATFRRVIARRPDTSDAYISLSHTQWEAGDAQGAIATLEQALKSGAQDRTVRIRLGLYLAESHTDPQRAIAVLEDSMTSDDVEALNGLGVAYGDAGRYDDALRAFRRILTLDSTNGIALQNVASMELRLALNTKAPADRQARIQEAERYDRQAIAADPQLGDAYTTLGVIQSTTGRKADAIDSWKKAVALDHEQFDALYNLWFELASAGRRDEARQYGQQFVETAPPALFAKDIEEVKRYLAHG
jgi:arylsulfatase A-like enzyme/tetratricopeptide (TPR) repeat protein